MLFLQIEELLGGYHCITFGELQIKLQKVSLEQATYYCHSYDVCQLLHRFDVVLVRIGPAEEDKIIHERLRKKSMFLNQRSHVDVKVPLGELVVPFIG